MPRAAIVGAGPSGFYAADQLLKLGFEVDLLELLPTPFGLVRAGVAPDHPKIKAVTRVYEKTAAKDGFRFFGGVELGRDITRADLLERYHAVIYAVGTSGDNRLGIPGEDRPGSHGATGFVAWYNGHPDAADHEFDLDTERAVVIGNGNVAIDVARMLMLHADELAPTDTADHAVDVLNASAVREVVVVGRRGPAQAAFTNPELRELREMQQAGLVLDPAEVVLDPLSEEWLAEHGDATAKRNVQMLCECAEGEPFGGEHRIVLRFLRSPVEILGEGEGGPVTGIRLVRNEIQATGDGGLRAVATDDTETLDCGLVFRSIGYRGTALDGVPFDERRGVIANEGGRVCDDDGHRRGEYVVGWIKRGPSGVIGTNKKDAADTTARIAEDLEAGTLNAPSVTDPAETETFLRERVARLVTWDGWTAIDTAETTAGAPGGRPRVKLVRLDDLHAAVDPPE